MAASEPDLAPEFKRAIASAVRWGWSELQRRCPDIIASGREEEITERLHSVLNELDEEDRRCAPGLDLFETVDRGAKVTTSDGRIEKAPDLVFRPSYRRGVRNLSDWGLFVECKIVNATVRHHSPSFYCENGVARFVKGEYAYRMPSGMMLAFVRDRSAPYVTLQELLKAGYATLRHTAGEAPDECRSVHDRSARSCVAVELLHLWLQPQD